MKVDISQKDYALLEVVLLPVQEGRARRCPSIELIKRKGKWLVNSSVPRWHPTIPTSQSS